MMRLPVVRGDCLPGGVNEARPCKYKGCRFHLDPERKWPEQVTDWTESCALDVADQGEFTLDEIGAMFGVSRERIRQLEEEAMEKFTARMVRRVSV
jgi:hypothetical protein